jgi:hypothetical protein
VDEEGNAPKKNGQVEEGKIEALGAASQAGRGFRVSGIEVRMSRAVPPAATARKTKANP